MHCSSHCLGDVGQGNEGKEGARVSVNKTHEESVQVDMFIPNLSWVWGQHSFPHLLLELPLARLRSPNAFDIQNLKKALMGH